MKEEIRDKEGNVVGEVVDGVLIQLIPDKLAEVLFEKSIKLTNVCQQLQAKLLEHKTFIKNNL